MDPVLLQKQVRDNADDLNSYVLDLKSWETEMKRKESELGVGGVGLGLGGQSNGDKEQNLPPVRSKMRKSVHKMKKDQSENKNKNKKIPGNDYSSWDRFDVDKACAEVDDDGKKSEEEESTSEEEYDEDNLREEGLYEKNKGNQFVKVKKWNEAIVCYSRAIECFAYDAIYYANRALCYLKVNEFQLAETDCTSSLQLDISYVKAYQRRAAARVGLGLFLEAKSDLEMILQLEPMNTESKVELIKVEKMINASTSAKLVSKVTTNEHTMVSPKLEKTAMDNGAGEPTGVKMSWGTESGVKLVQPINKPPHLRSKKPLKRIEIQEIGEIKDIGTTPRVQSPSTSSSAQSYINYEPVKKPKITETSSVVKKKEEQATVRVTEMLEERVTEEVEESEEVPPRPNSSVEFLVGWKKVKSNPNLAFLYLKQIPGAEIPNIFQESLESSTLSDLISTLANQFLQRGESVYKYLCGITNVKRLSALTLFMSSADQEGVKKLLSSCVTTKECNDEDATKLRLKFEL